MLRFLFSLAALLATLRPALVAGQLTWNSVTTAPHEYRLSPWWQVNARPQVRRYQLVAEPISAAPDGFSRIVYALNGQLPGPLIEANSYDTIAVTVINKLPIPLTVHWHGLWQVRCLHVLLIGTLADSRCSYQNGTKSVHAWLRPPNETLTPEPAVTKTVSRA